MNTSTLLPDGDRFLILPEVASILRKSVKTVRRMIEARELASVKVRGTRMIRASALQSYSQSLT